MSNAIREYKWYYLLFGVIGVVLYMMPLVKGEGVSYNFFKVDSFMGTVSSMAAFYPLIIVPFNLIYNKVYNQDYYDKVLKTLAVVIPLVSIIGVITFKSSIVLTTTTTLTYTPFYYLFIVYIIGVYSFNCYVSFYKSQYM